ncbi:hypothetical protein ACQKWADRAFT_303889 [Trichoderma austrokoningii]
MAFECSLLASTGWVLSCCVTCATSWSSSALDGGSSCDADAPRAVLVLLLLLLLSDWSGDRALLRRFAGRLGDELSTSAAAVSLSLLRTSRRPRWLLLADAGIINDLISVLRIQVKI